MEEEERPIDQTGTWQDWNLIVLGTYKQIVMLIKVKDKKTGVIYSSNMMAGNKHYILEMNFYEEDYKKLIQTRYNIKEKKVENNFSQKLFIIQPS